MKYLPCLLLAACADPIGHVKPDGGAGLAEPVMTTELPDGSFRTVIDATSEADWRRVEFALGREVVDDTAPWQLRTQRFHISTHAAIEAAPLVAAFTDVTSAPPDGYVRDADVDGDGEIDYAFDQGDDWYEYDPQSHILTPSKLVWVVRPTTPGTSPTFKLEILGYYDDAGTAGVFTFHWKPIGDAR